MREVAAEAMSMDPVIQRDHREKCGLGRGGSYMGELGEEMSSGTRRKARGEGSRTGDRYPSEESKVRVLPSDISAGKAWKRKPAVFTDLLITET